MTTSYIVGFFCGIAAVALLSLIVSKFVKKKTGRARKFDERQVTAQGRAYKWAYFTMILYCFIYGALCSFDLIWCETLVGVFIGIMLSISVLVVICIFEDAYFYVNESSMFYIWLFALLGVVNILFGVWHMVDGDFVENGVLGTNSINFITGVMVLVVDAALITKRVMDRRSEAWEDEES